MQSRACQIFPLWKYTHTHTSAYRLVGKHVSHPTQMHHNIKPRPAFWERESQNWFCFWSLHFPFSGSLEIYSAKLTHRPLYWREGFLGWQILFQYFCIINATSRIKFLLICFRLSSLSQSKNQHGRDWFSQKELWVCTYLSASWIEKITMMVIKIHV